MDTVDIPCIITFLSEYSDESSDWLDKSEQPAEGTYGCYNRTCMDGRHCITNNNNLYTYMCITSAII